MTLAEIQQYCLSLPGVTEDIKWETHLCFNVGGKMMLVTSPDTFPISASFKASDDLFEDLQSREGVIPAPYMARHKWLYVDDISRFSETEWKKYIDMSYKLIFEKLSAKLRNSILQAAQ